MQKYVLKHLGRSVGAVKVEQIGCYYRVVSRFSLKDCEGMHLFVECGKKEIDLGLCVRYDGAFGTERWLPVRQIGTGEMHFFLKRADLFVSINETEPFDHIDKLICARFSIQADKKGIAIPHNAR